jgi:hypothetical protein
VEKEEKRNKRSEWRIHMDIFEHISQAGLQSGTYIFFC